MAQVNPEHVQPLTVGFAVLLVASILALGALNHFADK